jgi:amidophosphoribosyltransferase
MPAVNEFIANGRTIDEISKKIGCDKLFYQNLEDLVEATNIGETKLTRFDTSCFDGDYVTGDISAEYLQQLEDARNDDAKQENQEEDDVIDMHNDDE